jgi:hypothetical protein
MKIFLPIRRSLLKLALHSGIAVNDTKLSELDWGEGSMTGLVEKVTTTKREFNQQDGKLYLCIYCLIL